MLLPGSVWLFYGMNLFTFLVGFLAQLSQSQTTTITSKSIQGATISYKKATVCSTVSYSGYVKINSAVVPGVSYNTSTFFWFFPARKPAGANLALYLAGGPGEASTFAALTENGPCIAQKDGNTLVQNPHSFNENAHVLYVDQPNQVGFSYDTITDGIFDALGGNAGSGAVVNGTGKTGVAKIKGKFPSQNPAKTALTSTMAAKSMWYFLQVFLADFGVDYGEKHVVNIWGNSYAGIYVGSLARYILSMNEKLPVKKGSKYEFVYIDTVGITNGCLDLEAQGAAYATFPYNNTYLNSNGTPVHLLLKNETEQTLEAAKRPGGCFDLLSKCRKLKAANDPNDEGKNSAANEACVTAAGYCNKFLLMPYYASERSPFDIGLNTADPNPPKYAATYLNKPSTRQNLGVPSGLNYTLFSAAVFDNFYITTGDPTRKGSDDLTALLSMDSRVAMIYGDRDWRCNWVGAENLTLSLPWTHRRTDLGGGRFSSSGYVQLEVPGSSGGPPGVTRQHTQLSFTRVFNAGHAVSWYAPATVKAVFDRVMRDRDVATGKKSGTYELTRGKSSAWSWKFKLPAPKSLIECSLWSVSTCTEAQTIALGKGTAKIDGTWKVTSPAK